MNFETLFNEYSRTPGFTNLSVDSKRSYIYAANKLSTYFKDADIAKLWRSDFIKMKDSHSVTPGSVNLILRVASVMFGYALDRDIVAANPVAGFKKNKLQGHVKWAPEEVTSFIANAEHVAAFAVLMAWYTGQRQGDILDMKMSDIADGYITVVQSKTKMEIKIKIHPDLERYIAEVVATQRGPEDYIVSGKKKMKGSCFRKIFVKETKRLNIEKVFHGIRKGVASSLAENGRSINEIAALLGHKSIRMAAYYAEQADGTKLAESAVSNLASVTVQAPY